jgi:hypothetical protein
MTSGPKLALLFWRFELDKRGKEKDHVAALVHNGRVAVATTDLAWENMLGFLA